MTRRRLLNEDTIDHLCEEINAFAELEDYITRLETMDDAERSAQYKRFADACDAITDPEQTMLLIGMGLALLYDRLVDFRQAAGGENNVPDVVHLATERTRQLYLDTHYAVSFPDLAGTNPDFRTRMHALLRCSILYDDSVFPPIRAIGFQGERREVQIADMANRLLATKLDKIDVPFGPVLTAMVNEKQTRAAQLGGGTVVAFRPRGG